jgi:hypothetical protein
MMKSRYEKRRKLNDELYRVTGCGIQYGGFPCGTCLGSVIGELKAMHPDLVTDRTWDAVFRFRGDYIPARLLKAYGKQFADNFEFTDAELTKEVDNLLAALKDCPDLEARRKANTAGATAKIALAEFKKAIEDAKGDREKIGQATKDFTDKLEKGGWRRPPEDVIDRLVAAGVARCNHYRRQTQSEKTAGRNGQHGSYPKGTGDVQ